MLAIQSSSRLTSPGQNDATALRQRIASGVVAASSVMAEHIDRTLRLHSRLSGASELLIDSAVKAAENPGQGLLAGVPISVKELFDLQGSRRPSIAGTTASVCADDAVAVSLLKREGAIVLARSNASEFGLGVETGNLANRRTNNPLNFHRTPGGSSGGEGALVGSRSTMLGLGTDLGGSIRIPAAFCGLTGFKPVSGAVDKTGLFPALGREVDSFLAVGPIARSVRDARLAYEIISASTLDPADAAALPELRLLFPADNHRIRCDFTRRAISLGKSLLEGAGMHTSPDEISVHRSLFRDYYGVLAFHLLPLLHEQLRATGGERKWLFAEGLRQLIGRPTVHRFLFEILAGMSLIRPSIPEAAEMMERITEARARCYVALGRDTLVLLPGVGMLAPRHGQLMAKSRRRDVHPSLRPTVLCNVLDLPAIVFPVWRCRQPVSNLVPSLMLVSGPGNEATLFNAAQRLEQELALQ